MILTKGLTRIYSLGDSEVVGIEDVDLDIAPGELVVLKGNSGSGKSTLLSLLAGLDHPTRGKITVSGHDLNTASPSELTRFRREVVGMVFQSFNLLPTINVMENTVLPALLAGKTLHKSRETALELLEWLQLSDRNHHLPAQLSGGEMQRTAIARALINDPEIILADEPTGNLDSKSGKIVIDLLAELSLKRGRTVIIATHSSLADDLASIIIELRDGMILHPSCSR